MKNTRLSLRLSLVLYIVVPLVIAVVALGYVVLHAFEEYAEQRMEEDAELVARAIRLPLSRALEQNEAGALVNTLESAFSINRVYGVHVYGASGELVAAAGGGWRTSNRGRLSELNRGADERGLYEEIGGQAVYSYFVPLTSSGGLNVGLLQVTRRASDIQAYVAGLRWKAGSILLTALVLIAGLVLYGHYGAIGKYLKRLRASMNRVERGERSHRASLRGPVEIASLSRTFNAMLDSIVQAEGELKERRATQMDLERQLRHAEKLAAIGQLAAGVAHELGTPLSVIDGKAQRMLRRPDLSDADTDTLRDVRAQVQRMDRIVRQLLDFGRRNTVQPRSIRAEQVAQMAANSLQAEVQQAGTTLTVDGPRPGPELVADVALVERALINLLRNAVEAAGAGEVRLTWSVGDNHVAFTVEDSGPGIDEAIRPRLFEPFFTTKTVGEGTGLGLAVVHGIAEEHGGRVEVGASRTLRGARFRLVLPLQLEQGTARTPATTNNT